MYFTIGSSISLPAPTPPTLLDHLHALYPAGTPGECLAYVKSESIRQFGSPDNLEDFARQIEELDAKHDVYLTTNTLDGDSVRSRGEYTRGTEAELAAVVAIVFDVDAKKPKHNYPTQRQIIDALADMPLAPSIIVVSGKANAGLHPYWLFDKPFIIGSDEDFQRVKNISKRWHALLKEKLAPYDLDSTFSLEHVFRPIGTKNKKYGSTVSALVFEPHRRNSLEDFEHHLPDEPPAPAPYAPCGIASGLIYIERARRYLASVDVCDPRETAAMDASTQLLKAASAMNGLCIDEADALRLLAEWDAGNPCGRYPDQEYRRKLSEALKQKPWGWLLAQDTSGPNAPPNCKSSSSVPIGSIPTAAIAEWELRIIRMDTVQPRKVDWLWLNRIPTGKLVSLFGMPGLGKSMVLLDFAARTTVGADWPDGAPGGSPGGVVILSGEDDPEDTLRPRLDAAGADCSLISLVASVTLTDAKTKKTAERLVNLQSDLASIEKAILATPNCKLFILDPINCYLGKCDSHKNAEVRGILGPVAEMCARLGVTCIFLGHLNKSMNGPAMFKAAGSMAFVAAARVAYVIAESQDDPNTRLFLPVKNNLAPNIGGLSFTVVADENEQPRVEWDSQPVCTTADEALSHNPQQSRGNVKSDGEWLSAQLANGAVFTDELIANGKAVGISRNRLFKAKDEIGAFARKTGFTGKWEWFFNA
ncbi:MAG: AAA family ATPase [Planctomycetota bacterium]